MHLALTLRLSRQPLLAVRGLRQQVPRLSCIEAAFRTSSPFCSSSGVQAGGEDVVQGPAPPQKQGPGQAKGKRRLDELCVELYSEHSLRAVQCWIAQGKVTANGKTVTKAGTRVAPDTDVQLSVKVSKFVSRAGYKLEAALDHLELNVRGLRALDAGISTGGFSDCLLQRGVSSLIGVDVGYGQVAERVRTDPRLTLLERTNLRLLTLQDLPGAQPCQLATLDLSFIALTTVLPAVVKLLAPRAHVVALLKPQFEAARGQGEEGEADTQKLVVGLNQTALQVSAGGVVEDAAVRELVFHKVVQAAEALGLQFLGRVDSPIRGRVGGNQEVLVGFRLAAT